MAEPTSVVEVFGKVAGIGGLSLAVAFFVFRDIIAKNIFPTLEKIYAYRLLRLIVICSFIVSIIGMILWSKPTLIVGNGNTTVNADSAKSSTVTVGKP